jgi:hypothetical protein
VARNGEERLDGARLDHCPAPQPHNTIAERAHDGKIVADEDEGEAEFAPQCAQQSQDLRLGGDVEAGDDLVGDDQGGRDRDGAGDAGALALPAAQLMGKASAEVPIETDPVEERQGLPAGGRRIGKAKGDERLGDDVGEAAARVERGWKIICSRARSGRSSLSPRSVMSRPQKRRRPEVGW